MLDHNAISMASNGEYSANTAVDGNLDYATCQEVENIILTEMIKRMKILQKDRMLELRWSKGHSIS